MLTAKANSLAIERMKEMDEQDRLARICTKQKLGTPIVSVYPSSSTSSSSNFLLSHYQRDIDLQQKVLNWIMEVTDEKPKGRTDFDHWLHDGTILVKGQSSFHHFMYLVTKTILFLSN